MAHTLATDTGEGDLNTATVTDDAFVLDTFVFSTGTFPVPGRTEDTLAEETAFFWFECTVVNRLWVQHFATGPGTDDFR